MKFPKAYSAAEIARLTGARLVGDEQLPLTGINEIHKVQPGDITFADNEKYFAKSLNSAASAVILPKEVECPDGKVLLISDKPFEAYNKLVRMHRPFQPLTARISESAQVHPSAIVEPGVYLGHHVVVGAYTYIQAGTYIGEHTHIGERVFIQAGAIIGTDAFYFQKTEKGYQKWTSGGRVVIEDEVQIGAGCTINKGVSGDTVIGAGTKIDCQVHIGHGAVIGRNCLIAAQCGISGKATLEDEVVLYGQVGVAPRVRIGKGAVVSAKSGVSKDLPSGKAYFGIPAEDIRQKQRQLAALRKLPEWMKGNR
ncbi:MAG: UDP-3-O-(3-hydroxymyristoyl)glucosamine N-acyltransferase [Saprospiraceae bacterium]